MTGLTFYLYTSIYIVLFQPLPRKVSGQTPPDKCSLDRRPLSTNAPPRTNAPWSTGTHLRTDISLPQTVVTHQGTWPGDGACSAEGTLVRGRGRLSYFRLLSPEPNDSHTELPIALYQLPEYQPKVPQKLLSVCQAFEFQIVWLAPDCCIRGLGLQHFTTKFTLLNFLLWPSWLQVAPLLNVPRTQTESHVGCFRSLLGTLGTRYHPTLDPAVLWTPSNDPSVQTVLIWCHRRLDSTVYFRHFLPVAVYFSYY